MADQPTRDDVPEDERLDQEAAAALEALYKAHARRGYALLRSHGLDRESAHDVLNDVFLRIGRHLRDGGDIASPRPYVMRAVHNAGVDWLSSPARKQRPTDVSRLDATDWSSTDEIDRVCDLTDSRASVRRLGQAVRQLPARQREVIEMRYFAGLSHAEIATALGVAEGTIRYHLSKGHTKLRELLNGPHGEGDDA